VPPDEDIMQTLTLLARAAALVAAVSTASACAPLRVNSYQWPGVEISEFRTFSWGAPERFATGDPRLDNNEIVRARIQRAVERGLAGRRLEPAPADAADVIVHVHARIDQRIESRAVDAELGPCAPGACGPYVYDAGTLLIDLVDRRTNRVAWRGWAEGSLDAAIDDQARLEQAIDEAVAKILARLPGGAGR
jgi:hypothetical protein